MKYLNFSVFAMVVTGVLLPNAHAQKAPQTTTDGGGNTLTFTQAGVTYKGKDGSTSTIPADRLNQLCRDPSKVAGDQALKEVCDDWAIYTSEGDHSSIGDPPQILPNDCSMAEVVSLQQTKGSEGYLSLEYQISALAAGHGAEGEGRKVQELLRAASPNPTSTLASVFQTFDTATNKYKCGAYIQGLYAPDKEEAQQARKVAISVYNRLGILNDRMKGYVEQRFRGADDVVDNAKTLAGLSKDRDDAFSDLVSSSTLMSLLAYSSDPSQTTVQLDMTEAERRQLISKLDKLIATGTPDKFTSVADLVRSFLKQHAVHIR